MGLAKRRRQAATPLAALGVLAHCAVWMVQTSCNGSAPTFASCGADTGPGFHRAEPGVLAAGVPVRIEACLGGGSTLRLDIQRFTVRADGLELGEVTSNKRCLTIPFHTLGAIDATLHVQAEVEYKRSVTCGTITYDTSSEIEVRVREPDGVLRFDARACDGTSGVLLTGSKHGFDYELGAAGEPLDYGLEQPPLLLDTGDLALQDDGTFKMPDASGSFLVTSLIAGDDFESMLTAYDPAEVARVEFQVVSFSRAELDLIARASLEHWPTCDTPPGTVSVEVLTPETCHLADDAPTGATMAELSFGAHLEVELVDPEAGACVLEAAYGDVTTPFSWPRNWQTTE